MTGGGVRVGGCGVGVGVGVEVVPGSVGGDCGAVSGVQVRPADGVPVVCGGSMVDVSVDGVTAGGAAVGASSRVGSVGGLGPELEAGGVGCVGGDGEEVGSSAVVWMR